MPLEAHRVRTVRLRRKDDPSRIGELVDSAGWDIPNSRLSAEGWQFDEPAATALRDKLHGNSKALREFIDGKIYLGLKTGLNDAFVIDTPTRDRLVGAHAGSSDVIKPFVGGQDLRRWYSENSGRWLILMPNGTTAERYGHAGEEQATNWLRVTYPAIADYLAPFEARARNRGDSRRSPRCFATLPCADRRSKPPKPIAGLKPRRLFKALAGLAGPMFRHAGRGQEKMGLGIAGLPGRQLAEISGRLASAPAPKRRLPISRRSSAEHRSTGSRAKRSNASLRRPSPASSAASRRRASRCPGSRDSACR